MKFKRILIIITIVGFLSPLWAQGIKVSSVGLNFGWYKPAMGYWNDRVTTANGFEKFKGSYLYGANVKVDLFDVFQLRLGGEFWKESVQQGTEKIKVNMIPLHIEFLANLPILEFAKITPHIGIGAGYNMVNMDYEIVSNGITYADNQYGADYAGYFLAGFTIPLVSTLSLDLEYKQVIGNYSQLFNLRNNTTVKRQISLNGPNVVISLNYTGL